jgi:hypothetical protein
MSDVWDLKLHEAGDFPLIDHKSGEEIEGFSMWVVRVPGGWLYKPGATSETGAFVPFSVRRSHAEDGKFLP